MTVVVLTSLAVVPILIAVEDVSRERTPTTTHKILAIRLA